MHNTPPPPTAPLRSFLNILGLPARVISVRKNASNTRAWEQTYKEKAPLGSRIRDISLARFKRAWLLLKAYLHGTTLSHATSLRQAYDTNCIV